MSTMNFSTSDIKVPLLVEFVDQLPICANTNKFLDPNFVANNGTVVSYIKPDYGTVTEGSVIQESELGYNPVTGSLALKQYHAAIAPDAVSKALMIKDFRNQIAKPKTQLLASQIEQKASTAVQLKAAHTVVLGGSQNFKDTANAISRIRASRGLGQVHACLSHIFNADLLSSGINYFNPAQDISTMFREARLGMYNTAEFFASPDVLSLETGTLTASGNITVDADLAEGANYITLKASTLTGTLKARQAFKVAGVNVASLFGENVGTPYSFVVQADCEASGNKIVIPIVPVTTVRPGANVTALPKAAAIATMYHDASSTYYGGIIWARQALMSGSAKFAELSGIDQSVAQDVPNGISIELSKGPDVMNHREVVRLDALVGFDVSYQQMTSGIWLKAS